MLHTEDSQVPPRFRRILVRSVFVLGLPFETVLHSCIVLI